MVETNDNPSLTPDSHLRGLEQTKAQAERELASVRARANTARVDYARALLHGVFPGCSTVIFVREWHEDHPRLLQVLSDDPEQEIFDFTDDDEFNLVAADLRAAVITAEQQIVLIGDDDSLLEVLDPGETDHDDWIEFVLYLNIDAEGNNLS